MSLTLIGQNSLPIFWSSDLLHKKSPGGKELCPFLALLLELSFCGCTACALGHRPPQVEHAGLTLRSRVSLGCFTTGIALVLETLEGCRFALDAPNPPLAPAHETCLPEMPKLHANKWISCLVFNNWTPGLWPCRPWPVFPLLTWLTPSAVPAFPLAGPTASSLPPPGTPQPELTRQCPAPHQC